MTDKTKNYLGWALVLAVLAVGVSALWYVQVYSRSSEPGAYRSFSVTGEGKVVAVPDIGRFTFSVVNEGGKDIGALQKDNVSKTNAIIDYLKQQKVDAKDITTEGYSLEPRYSYCTPSYRVGGGAEICPPASIVGYTVRQTVAVKVRDLAKVGDILAGVVSKGANNVSQLQFTVDDSSKLENEARAEAIDQAQARAKEIASAGRFKIGRLLSIQDNNYPTPYYGKALGLGGADMAMEAPTVPAPRIEPGSQEIVVNVTLSYEIR